MFLLLKIQGNNNFQLSIVHFQFNKRTCGGIGRRVWFRSHYHGANSFQILYPAKCGLSGYAPPRFALRRVKILRVKIKYAPVAELADAYGSGPYFLTEVQVQFLSGAPQKARFYRAFFIYIF